MIYVGNHVSWIQQDYIDFMLSNNGTPRPGGGRNPDSEEFRKAKENGYDLSQVYWYIFEPDTFFKISYNSLIEILSETATLKISTLSGSG